MKPPLGTDGFSADERNKILAVRQRLGAAGLRTLALYAENALVEGTPPDTIIQRFNEAIAAIEREYGE